VLAADRDLGRAEQGVVGDRHPAEGDDQLAVGGERLDRPADEAVGTE
jgi:hypothetical protein